MGLLFISPWLVRLSVFTAYPIIASLYYSFTEYVGFGAPKWIGFESYGRLFEDELFRMSLCNTLYYTILYLPLGLIVAITLALFLNLKLKEIAIYRTIIYFPSILPVFASSFIWIWLLHPRFGLINNLLDKVGLIGPGWLYDPVWSKPSIIIMSQWGIGGAAIILLASLQDVSQQLYEAAELDGANWWMRLIHITLPSISPVIFFQLLMMTRVALQIFTQAYIMTGGGPANTTLFYVLHLYRNAFMYGRMGQACAMAWILLVISLGVVIIMFKSSVRWVYYQAGR